MNTKLLKRVARSKDLVDLKMAADLARDLGDEITLKQIQERERLMILARDFCQAIRDVDNMQKNPARALIVPVGDYLVRRSRRRHTTTFFVIARADKRMWGSDKNSRRDGGLDVPWFSLNQRFRLFHNTIKDDDKLLRAVEREVMSAVRFFEKWEREQRAIS